jgi:hypothetical protein
MKLRKKINVLHDDFADITYNLLKEEFQLVFI